MINLENSGEEGGRVDSTRAEFYARAQIVNGNSIQLRQTRPLICE